MSDLESNSEGELPLSDLSSDTELPDDPWNKWKVGGRNSWPGWDRK